MRERRLPAAGGGLMPGFAGDARAAPRLVRKPEALSAFPLRRVIIFFFGGGFLFCFLQAGFLPFPCLLLPA